MIFQKYSGAGNKFAILNDIGQVIHNKPSVIQEIVENNNELDGVIFVERSGIADFKMNYFNKDGSGNALCGNGLRCTMKFINDNSLSDKNEISLEAVGKIFYCRKNDDGRISVTFPAPVKVRLNFELKVHFTDWWQSLNCYYVDVGSPHIVVFIDEIEKPKISNLNDLPVNEWGRNIRMHKDLMPEGANVNFVKVNEEKNELEIRSFERGVEAETLACGTGAISSAIVYYFVRKKTNPVNLLTRSEEYLTVELRFNFKNDEISEVVLTGNAEKY